MKEGDIVEYIGCSDEQVRWGRNDDPRAFLIIGRHYTIEKVQVHSQHTKVKLEHKEGMFNSVCFKKKEISVATEKDWEDFWQNEDTVGDDIVVNMDGGVGGSWKFNLDRGTKKWR